MNKLLSAVVVAVLCGAPVLRAADPPAVSPDEAIKRGVTTLQVDGASKSALGYAAVHVKRNGAWLLDRITEDELPSVPV